MKDWKDKKVLVVGAGMSGIAAVNLLTELGAECVLYDDNKDLDSKRILMSVTEPTKVIIKAGELSDDVVNATELLVLSPGVPADTKFVQSFKDKGITVCGEIELAYAVAKGRLAAITGTNGKTTTTSLAGQMVKDYFGQGFVVGNIGNPYTKIALMTEEDSVTVAEISSFQLETILQFHPQVSAILNITPDHMNRHHTMENYVYLKESIAKNQTQEDVCVLNYEDTYTRNFAAETKAHVIFFSSERRLSEGIFCEEGTIYYADGKQTNRIMNVSEMQLLGKHNVENVMAAIGIGMGLSIPMVSMVATIKEFKAVEHRIEFVASKGGVDYYNDSKGTNPDAAIKGIQAMNRPTILIGGGYDKGSTYDSWIEAFDGKVKKLVLIGQTREKIAECARAHSFEDIVFAEDLQEAVLLSAREATAGDAVLLSPACASWGMFPNYEVRGTMFKEFVHQLKG